MAEDHPKSHPKSARRFPPPWTISDTGSSWAVSDATGFTMVWFCYGRVLPCPGARINRPLLTQVFPFCSRPAHGTELA